jgi:hypothetical protein
MNDSWRAELRTGLAALINRAFAAGANQDDVFATVVEENSRLRRASERDPVRSDHSSELVVEEPSNDWPGADDRR